MNLKRYLELQQHEANLRKARYENTHWPHIEDYTYQTGYAHRSHGIKDMAKYYHHIQPGWMVEVYSRSGCKFRVSGKVIEVNYNSVHGICIGVDYCGIIYPYAINDNWFGVYS